MAQSHTALEQGAARVGRARWRALAADEAARLAYWTPVALGLGVWLYFAASVEPPRGSIPALWAAAFALPAFGFGAVGWRRVVLIALGLAALGFAAAELRVRLLAAPVWPPVGVERGFAYEPHAVAGRIREIAERGDGSVRLLLDRFEVSGLAADRTPARARLTVSAEIFSEALARSNLSTPEAIGAQALFTARLWGPPGPAEPGGFDYRLRAWSERIGALGRAQGAVELTAAAKTGAWDRLAIGLDRLRARLSARARAAAEGREGAIVAALLVGDRSAVAEDVKQALRDANLAHLLAISGLHMGLVCMTVFSLLRLLFALTPRAAGRYDAKKIAAAGALLVGLCYLGLAGAGTPAQRAYLMAAVAFGAVLVDRPAITLRAVALAATLILLWRPESVLEAGFQLSFAATTAMVAMFEASRRFWIAERRMEREGGLTAWLGGRLVAGAAALLVASLTAGVATAPFAAFAFNRLTRYGLLANLAAVPAMGLWIMPFGVAALALAPFGLDGWTYRAMALGVSYVLAVAEAVAAAPGATAAVKAGPAAALGAIALGGLWFCLWRGAAFRSLGLAPLALGLLLWRGAERPEVLVAPGGRVIGVLTESGRAILVGSPGSYAAELWLRRDGDSAPAEEVVARKQRFAREADAVIAPLPNGWRLVLIGGTETSPEALEARCSERTILLAPRLDLDRRPDQACVAIDRQALRRSGSLAIWIEEEGPRFLRAVDASGDRRWTR